MHFATLLPWRSEQLKHLNGRIHDLEHGIVLEVRVYKFGVGDECSYAVVSGVFPHTTLHPLEVVFHVLLMIIVVHKRIALVHRDISIYATYVCYFGFLLFDYCRFCLCLRGYDARYHLDSTIK